MADQKPLHESIEPIRESTRRLVIALIVLVLVLFLGGFAFSIMQVGFQTPHLIILLGIVAIVLRIALDI